MVYLLAACQLFLGLLLLLAAAGKLLSPGQFIKALQVSRTPVLLQPPLAVLVVTAEVMLAMSLLFQAPFSLKAAFIGTLLILGIFTGWLMWVRVQKISLNCGCFGRSKSDVGMGSILRNVVFMIIAALALWFELRVTGISLSPSFWRLPVGLIGSGGALLLMTRRLYELTKSRARVLPRAS